MERPECGQLAAGRGRESVVEIRFDCLFRQNFN